MPNYDFSSLDTTPATAPLPVPPPGAPAPATPTTAKVYDFSSLGEAAEVQQVQRQASMLDASFDDPDQEGKRRQLARDLERLTGVPVPTTTIDIPTAMREHRFLEADHATRASPRTSAFLSSADNAKVALDDAKTMAQIERVLDGIPNFARSVVKGAGPTAAQGFWGAMAAPFELADWAVAKMGVPKEMLQRTAGKGLRALSDVAKTQGQLMDIPEPQGWLERDVMSGAESLGTNLTTLPFGVTARSSDFALGLMTAISGGQSYLRASKEGTDPLRGLALAGPDATAEYVTERLGLKALFDAPGFKNAFLKQAAKFTTLEMGGEQIATVWQDFNDWMVTNPGKTLDDFIAERPEAARSTAIATLIGAGGQVAVVKGFEAALKQTAISETATNDAAKLSEVFQRANEMLLRTRDPVTFDSFFQQLTGDATVFIDTERLKELLGSGKVDRAKLPSVTDQALTEATNVGPGVEIPVSELVPAFAGTGLENDVVQHLRMAPGAETAAEATAKGTEAMQLLDEEVRTILQEKMADTAFTRSAEEVKADIEQRIGLASPFGPQYGSGIAKLLTAWYTTQAKRWGVTPSQIRDGWTDAQGNQMQGFRPVWAFGDQVLEGPGFDHGNAMLNIGLDVGAMARDQQVPVETVKAEIEKTGAKVLSAEVVESEYEYQGQMVKEMTYVPQLDRPLTEAEVNQIAAATGQEAIGQYYRGKGDLWGPNAAAWGAFNPEFFKNQKGVPLKSGESFEQKKKAPKITEIIPGQTLEQSTPLTAKQWADVRNVALETLNDEQKAAWLEAEQEVLAGVEEANRNSDVLKEIAKAALDKMPAPRVSTVPLLAGRLKLKIEPTGNFRKDGTRKTRVPDVARALFNKFRNAKASVDTPEGREVMARAMVHEALYALSQDGHAVGWYDRKVREAIMTFALVHPEVLTSPRHNLAFRLIAAITSNGQAVRDNFILANDIYNLWSKDQVFPTEFALDEEQAQQEVDEDETPTAEGFEGGGQRKPAMVAAFKKINTLVKELGWESLEQEMLELRTVRDVEKEFGLKIGGENKDTVIPTAVGLGGPKIGNFFANLSGYFDSPTMDLWFMRTAGRMEGTLLETKPALVEHLDELLTLLPESGEVKGQSVATLRKEIEKYKSLSKEEQLDAETTLKTLKHTSMYARAQFSQFASPHPTTGKTYWDKSDVNVNSRRLINNLAAVREAPSSGGERNNLRSVVTQAMELLQKQGITLTAADLQAVLWYHEKNLYSKLGDISASAKPWDYASAARFSVGRELGLVDVGARQRAAAVPDGQPAAGEPGGSEAVRGVGQEAEGQAFYQAPIPAVARGAVAAPFTAVHFSQQPRVSLVSSAFGTGLKGAERDRLATATDSRIKQRIAFYVNSGNGVFPESGVGAAAHVATLDNIYDADADVLKIWRNVTDLNDRESAVLDAGFSGYLLRDRFTNQGTAVLLGSRTVVAEHVGGKAEADQRADVPPAPQYPDAKLQAMRLTNDRSLPAGRMSKSEWRQELQRRGYPDDLIDWEKLQKPDDLYYKSDLAGTVWQQPEERRGSFTPANLEIRFLAQADYSTALHELGHFFLHASLEMAAMPNAPADVVADANAILAKAGVASVAEFRQMTIAQQTEVHEWFAESWEQYLFTGKAPSLALESLFTKFTNWMKRVYIDLKNFVARNPRAKLDPELSQLMDRLIATDEEIAQANEAREYQQLFKDAAEAGMTEAQFSEYLSLNAQQRADAEAMLRTRSLRDLKWTDNKRAALILEGERAAKARYDEMKKEVTKEVTDMPINKARRWLKKGEMTTPEGEELKVTEGYKLNLEDVKALFPEGALGERPELARLGYGQYGMLAKDGLAPDLVAEMFGFTSGDALVRALLDTPSFKDQVQQITDSRMIEAYGDLNSAESIAKAADEAIHNDSRLRSVATELWALNKNVGSIASIVKAAKEYAKQIVAQRTMKTLKPWQFAAAETRAAKAARAALKKGDREEAAKQVRLEILNAAAAKEAYRVETEVKRITDKWKKIVAYKDDSSAVKTRDMAIINGLRAILAEFGIGAKGKSAKEYIELVKAYDPVMGDVLTDLVDGATDGAKDWRQLTVKQIQDLNDVTQSLWYLAKRSRQIEVDGKLLNRAQIEQELYDVLEEIGIPDIVPGETSAVTPQEKMRMKYDSWLASLRRVESWVGGMDGTRQMGPFRKYIWNSIREAGDRYRVEKAKYLKQYQALIETIAPSLQRRLIDATRELNYTFGKSEGGMGKVELLHAVLHTGNESNKRKLLLGRKWATERQDGSLDTSRWDAFVQRMHDEGVLTKADYDFAQSVWDMLEEMKPAAQKAHRAVYGRFFDEVTADSFTNQFGTYRGGYVPATVDSSSIQDAALRELANQENENLSYSFPSTPKGFTKKRVEYNRPLLLDLRTLTGHIDKVLLFSHLTEPVSDVRRLVMSKRVAGALGRVQPQAISSLLTPWLNRAAKQQLETKIPGREMLGGFWSTLRSRAGMAAMFANVANSVQQVTGLSLAALKVKPKYLGAAAIQFATSPKQMSEFVAEHSEYMKTRLENEVAMASDRINEILINPSVFESGRNWTRQHAYFMQSAVDSAIGPIVWIGAYNQALETMPQGLDAEQQETYARRLADSAVRETQGSMVPEDVAAFETGSAFYRMFTQFAGYFNTNANLLGTEFQKIARDMGLRKGAGRGLYVLTFGLLAPALVGELIMQLFKGGPDDEDGDGVYLDDWFAAIFGYGLARYVTAMIPVGGTVLNAVVNATNDKPYDDRISTAPAVSMIESAVKAPLSVYKAITEEGKPSRAVKDVATLLSMITGMPVNALSKPLSYGADVAADRVRPTGPVDAVRGTISGTASPSSKLQ